MVYFLSIFAFEVFERKFLPKKMFALTFTTYYNAFIAAVKVSHRIGG